MATDSEQVLRWPDGPGWLILSAGGDQSLGVMDDIRASALTRITIDGGVAYVGLNEADHDDLIEEMGDMGAPTGYFVNVRVEDDVTIRDLLAEAGMILLPAEVDVMSLRDALQGAALEGMTSALARGAVVLAEGESIRLFGVLMQEGASGIGWLENAFVVPNVSSISEAVSAREILKSGAAEVAVGVGDGSALVLGPDRRVEVWGDGNITIALGKTLHPD